MRIYEKVEVPATTKRRLKSVVCDICGDESSKKRADAWSDFEAEVSMRDGTGYPEGGSGREVEYDICPKCFVEKFIPWLESQGAKTEWTEWDY